MNTRLRRGLIVGIVQVAMVASLGAKMLVDRATLPRVWVRTVPVDPEAFIRGRYLRLGVEVSMPANTASGSPVFLTVENGRLKAAPRTSGWTITPWGRSSEGVDHWVVPRAGEAGSFRLEPPLAFFIPENLPDPSRRPGDEELWVEVTVTHGGQLRPIRLGVRKDGVLRAM